VYFVLLHLFESLCELCVLLAFVGLSLNICESVCVCVCVRVCVELLGACRATRFIIFNPMDRLPLTKMPFLLIKYSHALGQL